MKTSILQKNETKKILWKKIVHSFRIRENMWWALYRLRVLALPKQCDDDVASVVGLNCPKLECIILTGTAVTNVGLSWLLCCRQLHTLIMPGFFQGVTPKGNSHMGSFNNYADIILLFFWPPIYLHVDIFHFQRRQKLALFDNLPPLILST